MASVLASETRRECRSHNPLFECAEKNSVAFAVIQKDNF